MKTQLILCTVFLMPSLVSAQDETGWDAANAIVPSATSVSIKDQVEISADIPGRIVFLEPNERGKVVTAGEVVVRLDSKLVEAQLTEVDAKAKSMVLIEYAQKALDAADFKLKSKQARNAKSIERTELAVFSEDEIRQLELEVIKANAELNKAKEDKFFAGLAALTKGVELQQYTVTAGISGIITDTHLKSIGSGVRQGDPILTIVNLSEVYAKLMVSPADESRINIGDKVLVRRQFGNADPAGENNTGSRVFGALRSDEPVIRPVAIQAATPVKTFVGEVSHIGKSGFDAKNLIEVWAVIKNEEVAPGKFLLREGSFIDARILSP